MDWYTCILTVSLLISFPAILAIGPPVVTSHVERWQHARAGETVRLPCPVHAEPAPIFQWLKDDDPINGGWDRHRVVSSGLRIKDVMEEDTGNYDCKVTNGFGSVVVEYYLHVSRFNKDSPQTNDSDEIVTPPSNFDGKYYPSDKVPFFVRMDQMSAEPMRKPLGSNIRLKCKAEGEPKPSIIWLKDGRPIEHADGENSRHPHWTLRLHDVGLADSGRYTCKVFNRAGTISFNYTIIVEDIVEPPLMADTPVNLTVTAGQIASFRCEVGSPVAPSVKWLKLVENGRGVRHANATVTLKGQSFLLLNRTGQVHSQRDGTWLNKLVLYHTTQEDAGHYICLATNSMGYSVRHAFLTVLPGGPPGEGHKYDEEIDFDSPSLPLIIAIPAAVVVIIVVVSMYALYRRRSQAKAKARSPGRSAAVGGGAPPQPPNPGQDKQYDAYHAYQAHHQLHPMLPPPAAHHQPLPMNHPMSMNPNTSLIHGVPTRDRMAMGKNYSDVHSDVSVPKVPMSPQAHLQNYQHHHMPYGC